MKIWMVTELESVQEYVYKNSIKIKGAQLWNKETESNHYCTQHIVLTLYSFLWSCMKIPQTVIELWCVQEFFEKN